MQGTQTRRQRRPRQWRAPLLQRTRCEPVPDSERLQDVDAAAKAPILVVSEFVRCSTSVDASSLREVRAYMRLIASVCRTWTRRPRRPCWW